MKAVSFLGSIVLIAVASWAKVYFSNSIRSELYSTENIQLTSFDPYIYCDSYDNDGNAFTSRSRMLDPGTLNQPKYKPKEAVSSGVQANPFLD